MKPEQLVVSQEKKDQINNMNYESMLRMWRFAPVGNPIFQGDTGKYYAHVMAEKKKEVGDAAHVAASKSIGWEKS